MYYCNIISFYLQNLTTFYLLIMMLFIRSCEGLALLSIGFAQFIIIILLFIGERATKIGLKMIGISQCLILK
jgi:hypothetical protein